MAGQTGENHRIDQLLELSREIKAVVLDLQKSLTAPDGVVFVRSCTSCLQDSCNKPPTLTTPPPSGPNPSPPPPPR
ncbi:MAG: hypothetical protein SFV54_24210 [Bryobacteraceae bacterium]|nr:hypothetical protein [Bryobacteraceae bacterium]